MPRELLDLLNNASEEDFRMALAVWNLLSVCLMWRWSAHGERAEAMTLARDVA